MAAPVPAKLALGTPSRTRVAAALFTLGGCFMLSYLLRNVNGVVAPDIMQDLGIGADVLGGITSAYLLAFAAAQLPVGVLLDRYGPRRVQGGLLLCAATGAALSAGNSGVAVLAVGRALIGLGTAGCLMAALKASAAWMPPGRLAMVNGLIVMCGGFGALAATWPAELGLHALGWRWLYAALAAFACAGALAVRCAVPGQCWQPGAQPDGPSLESVVRNPHFLRFAPLSASCFGTVLAMQGLWAGPWLSDVAALTREQVSDDLACMAVVLIIAAPCWGVLTGWLRDRGLLDRSAMAAADLLSASEALIALSTGLSPVLPWCLFALFGGMNVFSFSVLASQVPTASIGRANGALNTLHIGCSFLVQLGIGQIVALWPAIGGHYPAAAYQNALLLPIALQASALAWFAWPRRAMDVHSPALSG